ncbi:MAG: FecR domain-containing protein [Tannerellaceae bacterium]|jgi:ferric-dicitrate binding protein FerR (iron transport regulator)|nr:FecR domain-containing protein [Tannerellaceae bacterium]
MSEKQDDKLEERIRFVAKHYREGSLNTKRAWDRLAQDKGIQRPEPWRRYLMMAASFAVLLVSVATFYYWKTHTPEWVTIATPAGQLKEVYLPDSTLVSISSGSRIRYNARTFGKTRREVEMNGKAFYRVMRDEARPFSIRTKMAEVIVLGTSFQINQQDASIRVHVATGKVNFIAGEGLKKENIILTADMSASYSMETKEIKTLTEEDVNYLSWKTGLLQFKNAPLEKVIEDLSDYYQVGIRSRSMIRGEKLTATFNRLPLEEVLLIINQTLDVRLAVDKKQPIN